MDYQRVNTFQIPIKVARWIGLVLTIVWTVLCLTACATIPDSGFEALSAPQDKDKQIPMPVQKNGTIPALPAIEPAQLTARVDPVLSYSVSQNGSTIAVTSQKDNFSAIWIQSGDPKQVKLPEKILASGGDQFQAAFLPDHSGLIYVGTAHDVKGDLFWLKTNKAEQEAIRLTKRETTDRAPCPSPDGRKVYFHQSQPGQNKRQIAVLKTKDPRTDPLILDIPRDAAYPAISPNNRQCAFVSNTEKGRAIFLFDLKDKHLQRLTKGSFIDQSPAWSEDGKYVYFTRCLQSGQCNIWRISVEKEKTRPYPVTSSRFPAREPELAGGRLYFLSDKSGVDNVWYLPETGQIPLKGSAKAQLKLAKELKDIYPPDLDLTALAYQKIRQSFPGQKEIAALASLAGARIYARLGQDQYAKGLYNDLIHNLGVQPQAGQAEIRLKVLQTRDDWKDQVTTKDRRQILDKAIDDLKAIAEKEQNFPGLQAESKIEQAELLIELGGDSKDLLLALDLVESVFKKKSLDKEQRARAGLIKAKVFDQVGREESVIPIYANIVQKFPEIQPWSDQAIQRILDFRLAGTDSQALQEKITILHGIFDTYKDTLPRLAMGANNRIGDLYYQTREWVKAKAAYRHVLEEFKPSSSNQYAAARLALAEILYQEGRFYQALQLYESEMAVRAFEDYLYGLAWNGYIRKNLEAAEYHFGLGEISRARTMFYNLLQKDPTLIEAHRGYIKSVAAQNNIKPVLQAYSQELKNAPNNPILLYCLGLCLTYLEDRNSSNQAKGLIIQAIRIKGQVEFFHQTLGYIYEVLETVFDQPGKLELALQCYRKAFFLNNPEQNPRNRANLLLNLGNICFLLGHYQQAFENYQSRKLSEIPFQNKDTELIFYRRFARSAFLSEKRDKPIEALDKALKLIEKRLQAKQASKILGQLHSYIKERILLPNRNKDQNNKLVRSLFERQSAIQARLFQASRKEVNPPPDPGWQTYKTSLESIIKKQEKMIADLQPVVRNMDEQDWTTTKQELELMLKRSEKALEFPTNLRIMQAEMLDRLGLAYQETDQWAKARKSFLQAYVLNKELGQNKNLAPNLRSAAYNAYLQASRETGQKRQHLLNQALDDFKKVIDLVGQYGVPAKKKDQAQKGLISISLDIALEEKTATQAQYGFSPEQEKRLARAFISRIQTELGRLYPARQAAEQQLESYPPGKSVSDKDIFGVSLLLHRSAQLESALDNPVLANQRFLRSAQLALKMGNPISSAVNVSNAAYCLAPINTDSQTFQKKIAELGLVDKKTNRLLSKKSNLISQLDRTAYHNQMGVAWAILAIKLNQENIQSAARSTTLFSRAGSHFFQGLRSIEKMDKANRKQLSLQAAIYINLADLANQIRAGQSAQKYFAQALEVSKQGCLASFKWRALAGLGNLEEALTVLSRVPLFEQGCGPGEVLQRLAPLVQAEAEDENPVKAFNLLERLTELERINRMTPLVINAISKKGLNRLIDLKARLDRIKGLKEKIKNAQKQDQRHLQERLSQEQQILEKYLAKERVFPTNFLNCFQDQVRRDIFLELTAISAAMLEQARTKARHETDPQAKQATKEYQRLSQEFADKLDMARTRLTPNEPAGLLGFIVPDPVQAVDLATIMPESGKAIRLLPFENQGEEWLAIVLTPGKVELNQVKLGSISQVSDNGPQVIIYENPCLFKQIGYNLMALSGTNLVRAMDNKKPFKNKVLSIPKPIELPEPFQLLTNESKSQITEMAKLTEQAHSFLVNTDVAKHHTVPTRQGQIPTPYLGLATDQGQYLDLTNLANRLDNVSLAILNQASIKDAYLLGHLLVQFGVPTVLIPKKKTNSVQELQRFFQEYSKSSVSKALSGDSNKNINMGALWLSLGYWGLGPNQASELARQRFATYVRGGVKAYKEKDYIQSLAMFENGLNVVKEMPGFRRYKSKLLRFGRDSAFSAGQMNRASELAKDLAIYWSKHKSNSQAQAQALIKQGLILSRLEKFDQAVPCLQQAVQILSELDLPLERIQALADLGTVLENATEYDKALHGYQTAADLSQEMGATELLARQETSIGRIYDLRLSRYALAKKYYGQAQKAFQELGLKAEALQARLDIARCDRLLGRFDQTENILDQILEKAKNLNDNKRLQTKIVLEQANCAWFQAEYQKAFNLLQKALDRAREGNWVLEQVIALNTSGLTWWSLGKNDRSQRDLDRALELAKSLEIRRDEVATTYNNIGLVLRDQQQYEQALRILNKALAIDRQIGSRWAIAYDLRNIGLTYLRQGKPREALPLLDKALALTKDIGNTVNQAKVLVAKGNCHLQLQEEDRSKKCFQEALYLSRQISLRETIWRSLYGLGMIFKEQGRLKEAREKFLPALDVIEQMRADIKITQLRNSFIADKMQVYEALVSVLLDMGRKAEAFYTAERSRARNLIDMLGNQKIRLGKNQKLYDRLTSLKAAILEQEKLVSQAENKDAAKIYQESLDKYRDRYNDLLLRVKSKDPELASLVKVDSLSIQEVADLLDPGMALLSYYLLPQDMVCWVIKPDQTEVVRVPVKRSKLNALVLEFRRTLQNLEPYQIKADRLSSLLIEPLSQYLDKSEQIGIVPHRMLHYQSFAALNRGKSSLIEEYPLFYLPSASVMRYTIKRRSQPGRPQVLAIGNPSLDNPQLELPFAEHEVKSIGWNFPNLTTLLHEEATEGWLVGNINRFSLIHIASHGSYDPLNPLFSSIKLADDLKEDGDLKAAEVFGLDISAEMVVLSACQSGLGEIQAGDEVIGLNRAFMFAGTHVLVSSLWRVSDISTAMLMKQFYRELSRTNKANSLRRAMLHVRTYYSHPGYWAGFILSGDYL